MIRENSSQPQKSVPRNNEYLEKQSKNSDIRGGPSPAQACDAPPDINQQQAQNSALRSHRIVKQQLASTTNNVPTSTTLNKISANSMMGNTTTAATPVTISATSVATTINSSSTMNASPVVANPTAGPMPLKNQVATAQQQLPIKSPTIKQDNTKNKDAVVPLLPKVTLKRLKPEDVNLMENSLSEFVKKSPFLARRLGVVKPTDSLDSPGDMFTQMKADG